MQETARTSAIAGIGNGGHVLVNNRLRDKPRKRQAITDVAMGGIERKEREENTHQPSQHSTAFCKGSLHSLTLLIRLERCNELLGSSLEHLKVELSLKSRSGSAGSDSSKNSSAVCSCPFGCCSRHNKRRTAGHSRLRNCVRVTFAWQARQSVIISLGSLLPGLRWCTATERLPRFNVVQSGTAHRLLSRARTSSRCPPKYSSSCRLSV